MRWRRFVATAVTGLMLVAVPGTALAAQETADEPATTRLDNVKERVLDRIAKRIDRFEETIAELGGASGVVAEQKVALAQEGVDIFETAATEVAGAETVREVLGTVADASREFRAHRRVRGLYAHVQRDIDKFTRRLGRLDAAIDRAEEAGADVAEAAAESEAAAADLAEAQELLDAIDPSQTGGEVLDALKEAHRTAHHGQRHIRLGWKALFEALPPG